MAQSGKTLPARPNLEHLKKQAKQRLRSMRRSDADAKLADAQRGVVREYGFDSWRKLQAHVMKLNAADARTEAAAALREVQPLDADQQARASVRRMKRNWSESSAVIEQRFDDLGQDAQWTPTGIGSPTLLEREADDYIQKSDQPGQYRVVSIWHSTASDFEPTRALEFLAGAETGTTPVAGAWRRVDWQPAKVGFASEPSRWDDIAEAITFLHDRAAGEYRVVTVRRMLDAKRVTGRLKIGKHHFSGSEQAKYDAQT